MYGRYYEVHRFTRVNDKILSVCFPFTLVLLLLVTMAFYYYLIASYNVVIIFAALFCKNLVSFVCVLDLRNCLRWSLDDVRGLYLRPTPVKMTELLCVYFAPVVVPTLAVTHH